MIIYKVQVQYDDYGGTTHTYESADMSKKEAIKTAAQWIKEYADPRIEVRIFFLGASDDIYKSTLKRRMKLWKLINYTI